MTNVARQCIYSIYGGNVEGTGEIVHGKTTAITHDGKGVYVGLEQNLPATRADLDRRAETLRDHSAYRETRTDQDVTVVEGRDPDDLPIMIVYAADKQRLMRELPARIYAW